MKCTHAHPGFQLYPQHHSTDESRAHLPDLYSQRAVCVKFSKFDVWKHTRDKPILPQLQILYCQLRGVTVVNRLWSPCTFTQRRCISPRWRDVKETIVCAYFCFCFGVTLELFVPCSLLCQDYVSILYIPYAFGNNSHCTADMDTLYVVIMQEEILDPNADSGWRRTNKKMNRLYWTKSNQDAAGNPETRETEFKYYVMRQRTWKTKTRN